MDKEGKVQDGNRRRGIQSVEIGLGVLQTLSKLGRGAQLVTIAQACEMSTPQAHRYLQSLVAAGMAQQDAASGRYELGPAAIKLGLAALSQTDAFTLVDSVVKDFTIRTGHTVQIAALGPNGPTIVRWYSGCPGVTTSLAVGSVLSIVNSATGRVFLAFAAPGETAHLVKKELRRFPLTKAELGSLCETVRAEGRAHVSEKVIPGLNAMAYPIFDLQGRPVLTATLLCPVALVDPALESSIEELGEICRQLSIDLGWSGGDR